MRSFTFLAVAFLFIKLSFAMEPPSEERVELCIGEFVIVTTRKTIEESGLRRLSNIVNGLEEWHRNEKDQFSFVMSHDEAIILDRFLHTGDISKKRYDLKLVKRLADFFDSSKMKEHYEKETAKRASRLTRVYSAPSNPSKLLNEEDELTRANSAPPSINNSDNGRNIIEELDLLIEGGAKFIPTRKGDELTRSNSAPNATMKSTGKITEKDELDFHKVIIPKLKKLKDRNSKQILEEDYGNTFCQNAFITLCNLLEAQDLELKLLESREARINSTILQNYEKKNKFSITCPNCGVSFKIDYCAIKGRYGQSVYKYIVMQYGSILRHFMQHKKAKEF